MDLPFSKIIVDSRHAAAGTSSSFEVALPETLTLPHNAVCYVCDLQITNTFMNAYENMNTFYWIENELSQNVLNRVFFAKQTYTPDSLAIELQTKLNEVSIFRPTPGYVVTFEEDLGALKITRNYTLNDKTFFLANDDLIPRLGNSVIYETYDPNNGQQPWPFDVNNLRSAMSYFGLGPRSDDSPSLDDLTSLGNVLGNTHFTSSLDLRPYHCVYLHSATLTNYKVLGPAGSRSCIARVPVNSGYGTILTHQHSGHVLDYIPCGGVMLRTLSFELRNANNERVNMRGGHVSFSIIFSSSPLV